MDAYHRFVQTGLVAQGLLQYLSASFPRLVFSSFGSWFRTIRTDFSPSELVTAIALRQSLPEFLSDSSQDSIFKKFIIERIDLNRSEGIATCGVIRSLQYKCGTVKEDRADVPKKRVRGSLSPF